MSKEYCMKQINLWYQKYINELGKRGSDKALELYQKQMDYYIELISR